MKPGLSKLLIVFTGAIIFNMLFWNEKPGLNTVLFDLFICSTIIKLFPYSLQNNTNRWLLAGHVITASMVLWQNTVISKIAFSITLLLFVSFSQYLHRSVWYAAGSSAMNYLFIVPNFFTELKTFSGKRISLKKWYSSVRKLVMPLIILSVFLLIYSYANTVLSTLLGSISATIQRWVIHFFKIFSLERTGFFLSGLLIVGGLVLRCKASFFSTADLKQENVLLRRKNRLKKWKQSAFSDLFSIISGKSITGVLALKNENATGILSLVLLNGLLLFVNSLDIKYLWAGFTFKRQTDLSGYVHEGAGVLILSIVLAMLLLLFFFRGNLNFYNKNKWLRYGAYIWIVQNAFLVLSVSLRNYYYILHLGLAYKRLGLLFFLLLVLIGLITVFLKIYQAKSVYYLLRVNAWAAIFILITAAAFHWDTLIATYNLSRKSTTPVDVPFLLSLSNKTLPLLQNNIDVLEQYSARKFYTIDSYRPLSALEFYEYRKAIFLKQQQNYTWLSWNVADAYVVKFFLAVSVPVK